MASGMSTDADQQRQFKERLARLSSNKAAPTIEPSDLGSLRKPSKGVGNSNGRFIMAMVLLCVLAGAVGYFASGYKESLSKPEKVDPTKVKLDNAQG